jgi:formylglycine-generating enzyme required for sulfatase activity
MGTNPSNFKGDNLPVEQVSWNEVQNFLVKLNSKTGKNYRLPTEAEWEYAARGGNKSLDFIYSGSDILDDVAWYVKNSYGSTHPIGQKKQNELGLYDMCGNVWEWCSDFYTGTDNNLKNNPKGPIVGWGKVERGGGWKTDSKFCEVWVKAGCDESFISDNTGFRIGLSI